MFISFPRNGDVVLIDICDTESEDELSIIRHGIERGSDFICLPTFPAIPGLTLEETNSLADTLRVAFACCLHGGK